jgi:hypothetical protein
MAIRSTTSELQPSPPFSRIGGRVVNRVGISYGPGHTHGVKPNLSCAPATNGDRAAGLAPSQPASTKKMMKLNQGGSY